MPRAPASARAAERRASLEGEQSPWEMGTSEPRTRGEGDPDSSADEGLEVDLHDTRCQLFANEHRVANGGRRSGRSSDRTEHAPQTDDGGRRSDPMAPAHGFRCGISPGGERELSSEAEAPLTDGAPSGAPRVVERGRGGIGARNSHGGPGPDREPLHPKARAGGAGVSRGNGSSASERGRRKSDSVVVRPGPRERKPAGPRRSFPGCHGATQVRPGGSRGESFTASRTRTRRRAMPAGVRKGAGDRAGAETGRESRPGTGGKPPAPAWKHRRGPSRIRPPATRGASSARPRGEPRP